MNQGSRQPGADASDAAGADLQANPVEPALIAVDVATAVLRRGVPVVVADGPADGIAVIALEAASTSAYELVSALCGSRPRLLWSRPRSGLFEQSSMKEARDGLGSMIPALRLDLLANGASAEQAPELSGAQEAATRLAKLAGLLPAVLAAPLPAAPGDPAALVRRAAPAARPGP